MLVLEARWLVACTWVRKWSHTWPLSITGGLFCHTASHLLLWSTWLLYYDGCLNLIFNSCNVSSIAIVYQNLFLQLSLISGLVKSWGPGNPVCSSSRRSHCLLVQNLVTEHEDGRPAPLRLWGNRDVSVVRKRSYFLNSGQRETHQHGKGGSATTFKCAVLTLSKCMCICVCHMCLYVCIYV